MTPSPDTPSQSALNWLLEEDNPCVRYLALRDVVGLSPEDAELRAARHAAHAQPNGPIAAVLDAMAEDGYWVEPGPGYNPKYRSTVWALVLLAQLGASAQEDERIARACRYIVDQALSAGGQFSAGGADKPSATADCLQGNLCAALLDLGYDGPRLDAAFEWMARSVTGEGVAPIADRCAPLRYYAGKCGPRFACGANNKLPCAWGAVKVMLAFAKLPHARRTPLVEHAIRQGVDFLLSVDPATAGWPSGWTGKPSGNWWKFGFPVFYVTDLLQVAEALALLGHAADPRLRVTLDLIRAKADGQGRWPLEYDYTGKTWIDVGKKKQPSKWVTLRALRVLREEAETRLS
ncbi:MAG: nitrogen fixation protein NifH [Anaerolineae bacterium]|nr:nitrogen fixation protein NifH [Anaerolineae bacterium]